jgi:hypothetical protein
VLARGICPSKKLPQPRRLRPSTLSTTNYTSNPNSIKMSNPNVFFDISIGGQPAGRIVMELRADVVPKVRNSLSLPAIRNFPLDPALTSTT